MIWPFQTIQTLRHGFSSRAGLLAQPGGSQILDVGNDPMVCERFISFENFLAAWFFYHLGRPPTIGGHASILNYLTVSVLNSGFWIFN